MIKTIFIINVTSQLAFLNVKLNRLGAVLEGGKLFPCPVTDHMPQYYDPARNEFYFMSYKMKHLTCGEHLLALPCEQSLSTLSAASLRWHMELMGSNTKLAVANCTPRQYEISLPGSNLFLNYLQENNCVTSRFSWAITRQGQFHFIRKSQTQATGILPLTFSSN